MLGRLTISNYALIDSVELTFGDGLTIITGETGSGKSIMLGALSLLTGVRADVKSLSESGRKAVVEAEFRNVSPEVAAALRRLDIECVSDEVILRREILPSGRSRAFVNDTPVTLPALSEIAGMLIDIHTQHSNILLSQPQMQLSLVDSFAGDAEILEDYRKTYSEFVTLRARARKMKNKLDEERQNREFVAFQLEQLDKVNPKRGELAVVEREYDLLSDAEENGERLSGAYRLLDVGEGSAVAMVEEAMSLLDGIDIDEPGEGEPTITDRLHTVAVELRDIAETVGDWAERVHSDPSRLARLSSRMNLLYETIKRFRVADEEALVELHDELRERLGMIDGGDDSLDALEKRGRHLAQELKVKASRLSEARRKGAALLSDEILEAAMPLGLPNLRFEARLEEGKLGHDGQESVEFYCSFNRNRELQPLSKIASGGELARIMLALKSVMARAENLPTVIFDEIDTGVSGEIADRMGGMMKDMGGSMQVMAVTHLPQVAAKGRAHFKVFKTDSGDKTVTGVRCLSETERERELAAMMSGSDINRAALQNARALLKSGK